jgi:hypothetical protein
MEFDDYFVSSSPKTKKMKKIYIDITFTFSKETSQKIKTSKCKNCFNLYILKLSDVDDFCSKDCKTTYKITWKEGL